MTSAHVEHVVDAQCPACGLHELVPIRLSKQRDGTWVQLDKPSWFRKPPSDDDSTLTVQLDTCPVCFGAWFDAGELNILAGDLGSVESVLDDAKTPSKRVCPHGHGPMIERELPSMLRTPVERCDTCGGVWLDGNERRKLAKGSTSEGQGSTTERWLKRGAIWAAQVLTNLPVEVENPARGTPWIVYALLSLFLGVYFGQQWDLIWTDYYGLKPARLWHEQDMFTVAAYMFMHGSWVHLLFNAYFLYTFGDNVEHLFGHVRFAAFFIVTGLLAGVIHFAIERRSMGLVVGASGAISGVLAAYLWAFPRQRLYQVIVGIQFKIPVWVYVAGWFAIQAVMGLFATGEGASQVAWFAHIGGFAAGLAIAPIMLQQRRRRIAAQVAVPAVF